ncbi:MAG: response regulator [Flavobacteriales bacterium]|nr:response regulator [Flavobacteriales bacterium]
MKVIIVDDEKSARDVLSNLLLKAFPKLNICSTAENVPEAAIAIKKYQPHLVFLDVEMPEYAGYEIVKFIPNINFQIIFATAYDKFAIKAFEMNAIDYLVKPIDRKRLYQAVEKAQQRIEEQNSLANYQSLIKDIAETKTSTITVPEAGNKKRIKTSDILAVSAEGAYSKIHLEKSQVTISKNIGAMETELTMDNGFFRSHKSWLINTQHIKSYSLGKQEIILNNGTVCKLSRFKKSEFELALNSK